MAADKSLIRTWLYEAKERGTRYLIVVCDTFDYEDYPVHIGPDEDFWIRYTEYNGTNMQRIMEVYDMKVDIEQQLSEHRVMHCPPQSGK